MTRRRRGPWRAWSSRTAVDRPASPPGGSETGRERPPARERVSCIEYTDTMSLISMYGGAPALSDRRPGRRNHRHLGTGTERQAVALHLGLGEPEHVPAVQAEERLVRLRAVLVLEREPDPPFRPASDVALAPLAGERLGDDPEGAAGRRLGPAFGPGRDHQVAHLQRLFV